MLSQRLIAIIFLSNILITLLLGAYYSPETYSDSWLTSEINVGEERIQDFYDEDLEQAKDPNQITEQTAGETSSWSIRLWRIFRTGMKASISADMFSTDVERLIAGLVNLYRVLTGIILALEIFFILKNRKNT